MTAESMLLLLLAASGDAGAAEGRGLGFIEAGLVIFFLVFVAILAWVLMGRAGRFERHARIPLEDEPVTPIDDLNRGGA
ncbi:MAG: cbb3-type cytochrome c oxidase subunit 3 [Planctomycetota bacterium]